MTDHVVYTAWTDRRKRPLYVGCTSRLNERMGAHRRSSSWYPLMRQLEQSDPMPRIEALALERRHIRFRSPIHNKTGRRYFVPAQTLSEPQVAAWFGLPVNRQAHLALAELGLYPIAGPLRQGWYGWSYDYDDFEVAWIAYKYATAVTNEAAA